jgi:hypothetical protein
VQNIPAFLSSSDDPIKIIQGFCKNEHLADVRNRLFDLFQQFLWAEQQQDIYTENYAHEFWCIWELVKAVEAIYMLSEAIKSNKAFVNWKTD